MTTTTTPDGNTRILLKSDELGRVRLPVERREALLDEFERSGMSGQAFAKWAGVKYPTFANWRQQRRKTRGEAGQAGTVEWVEARLPEAALEAQTGLALTIHLPGGARMEVGGIGQVALAVEVLRRLGAGC